MAVESTICYQTRQSWKKRKKDSLDRFSPVRLLKEQSTFKVASHHKTLYEIPATSQTCSVQVQINQWKSYHKTDLFFICTSVPPFNTYYCFSVTAVLKIKKKHPLSVPFPRLPGLCFLPKNGFVATSNVFYLLLFHLKVKTFSMHYSLCTLNM